MNRQKHYFILFSNCLLVKGHTRSTICDLQEQRYKLIPNLLYDILSDNRRNGLSLEALRQKYKEHEEGIDLYIKQLSDEHFGFISTLDPDTYFPQIKPHYEHSGNISNAIIDFNHGYDYRLLEMFIRHLSLNHCNGVQLRCYSEVAPEILREILGYFTDTEISSIELLAKYSADHKKIIQICKDSLRAGSVTFHSAPKDKSDVVDLNKNTVLNITYSTQEINSCDSCGQTGTRYFILEQSSFLESMKFNSCLNLKISVDEHGYIKNCPSLPTRFGHLTDKYTIENIVNKEAFREFWKITKDKIEDCKLCEYRYMCQDCRAYTVHSDQKISKPLKCNYNPKTGDYITN